MNLTCIKCGNSDGGVTIGIDSGHLICTACNETFTPTEVRVVIDQWTRVLPWIESHPGEAIATIEQPGGES